MGSIAPSTPLTDSFYDANSPTTQFAASGSAGPEICVYDAATGHAVATWHGHEAPVSALAYTSAGGGLVASAAHDGVVRLWDVRSGSSVRALPSPLGADTRDAAASVAVGHIDANLVCVGYESGQVALFDASSGRLRDLQSPHTSECRGIDLSPDDAWLLTG